jgi:hypothetical protein
VVPGLLVALGRMPGAPEFWRWVAGLRRSPADVAMPPPSASPNARLLACFLTVQTVTVEVYRDDASPATAAAPCAETR